MFQRGIGPDAVLQVIGNGEMIANYPDETPHPEVLLLGFDAGGPIHVVVARNSVTRLCHVVTAYRPDPDLWEGGFRQRRWS